MRFSHCLPHHPVIRDFDIICYMVKYKNILSIVYSIYIVHCHLNSSWSTLLKATSYTLRKNNRIYQNHKVASLYHSSEDNLFLSPYLVPVQFAETVAACSYRVMLLSNHCGTTWHCYLESWIDIIHPKITTWSWVYLQII